AYLYEWLKDFGFTAWDDIYRLADAQSGKQVFSSEFVLLKDREVLILTRKASNENDHVFFIGENETEIDLPINLTFSPVTDIHQAADNRIFVDADRLQYPLELRRWREGDVFQPFGMSGTKKVSKYFKDEKFALTDKTNAWILCSAGEIVWIVGRRMDDRFKVTGTTKNILQITAS
ncbi:MAG: tRNA(Ile)-lysidine synthetase, partial [Flavobacterium sp.]